MAIISFRLNEKLYLRDPQSSELGQRIIEKSIFLIDTLGFENFTFKKLAETIGSTEASVYRYFENKHKLLVYLIDWYWIWLDFKLDFRLSNVHDPKEKLSACLKVLSEPTRIDPFIAFVDETALHRITSAEFEKTYHTKQVDIDNKEGLFVPYKVICKKIASILKEINPQFPFPHALVSTIMLAANHQLFYAEHLPSLTDIKNDPQTQHEKLHAFIELVVFKSIN